MSEHEVQSDEGTEQAKVRVRYDTTEASFASQFVINATREELIVNFSSGYLADPQTKDRLLPIQTRIAMSPNGAARLVNTLTQALRNMQQSKESGDEGPADSE
jgi:hypothetical protein